MTAFVSERAVPQLADAAEVLAAAQAMPGLAAQVLVPNRRYCDKALAAGATFVAFVLSVSEKHNINNVRSTPQKSVEEYRALVAGLPAGTRLRLNVATAFDCPFDGPVDPEAVIAILDQSSVSIQRPRLRCATRPDGRCQPRSVRSLPP